MPDENKYNPIVADYTEEATAREKAFSWIIELGKIAHQELVEIEERGDKKDSLPSGLETTVIV